MGLEKAGLQLGKEIIAWTKTSGAKSILQNTKPVSKIDFKGLRLALPHDTISLSKNHSCDFSSKIQKLLPEGVSSNTFKKLFSNEFKPLRKFDENGYYVTTVINKNTQKPQEIFIKKMHEGQYNIFFKNPKGEYEIIGRRRYDLNPELRQIEPGWMSSLENDKYSGVGIRCHQLAVEDAIRHNYNKIMLSSLDEALKFHEKSLFVKTETVQFNKEYLDGLLETIAEHLDIKLGEAKKLVQYKITGNSAILELNKTVENINQVALQRGKSTFKNTTMLKLDGERLELWKQLAMSQPITI